MEWPPYVCHLRVGGRVTIKSTDASTLNAHSNNINIPPPYMGRAMRLR